MSSPATDLEPVKPTTDALVLHDASDMFWDSAGFNHALRLGRMFAKSGLAPKHLDEYGCAIGVLMARQMRENPLTVLQAMYVVSGKPGWSAQYVIARAAQCGVFRGPIDWRIEGNGDGLAVTAFAALAGTGAEVSFTASMAMARAEGWTGNKKYQTLPELMLRYRSATLLVRLYAPGVMLGLSTREEIEDVEAEVVPRRGPPQVVLPSEVETDGPLDLRDQPRPTGNGLGALGLAPARTHTPPAAGMGDAPGGPAAVSAAVEADRADAAARSAALKAGYDIRGGPVAADPKADAECIAAFVGHGTKAPSDCKEALKATMRLARLDTARWNAAVAYATKHDLLVDVGGALRKPLPIASDLPPEVDDDPNGTQLGGADLRTEILAIEKDMDPEVAARLYSASFEKVHEDVVANFDAATDKQLRRYLSVLLDAAEA